MNHLKWTGKSKYNPYHRKLHGGEVTAMMAVILTLCLGSWLGEEQQDLAEGMIRLHVVANSNSEFDQNLKYDVRDQILQQTEQFYEEGLSVSEAEALFLAHIEEIISAGETASQGQGISAQVTDLWFPTKEYDNFSLPAGEYRALEVKIGEGEGENWWCVAYPPLCVGAASQTMEEAVEAGNFSTKEMELVTGENYVLKFKSMEMLGNLMKYFS